MRPDSTNSMIAWTVSQSMMARWTAASERRRRSFRGGKCGTRRARYRNLEARTPFEPDQEAEGQHHRRRVAMKAVPTAPLKLVPPKLALRLLVELLDPMAPVRVLDHLLERGPGRETAPEVL